MVSSSIVKIASILMALMFILVVNPAFAEEKKDEVGKTNETLASMQKININEADAETLATLKGIGKDRAVKIIEYREKNGPFQKPEDIMKVKGIGQKIFEQNKNVITI